MSTGQVVTVRVSRRFEASAERVFDAWLDPKRAGRWLFATPTGTMVRSEIDARVGGAFCFVDRRDGEDVEHVGKYLEIDRPRRLVFTFAVPKFSSVETRVSIDIVSQGTGCELTLVHEGVLPEYASGTQAGWTGILDRLAATASHKDAAVSFLRLVSAGKVREAYEMYVSPEFRHHNAFFRGDADSLRAAMEENFTANPEKTLETLRALEDGDLVAVHSRMIRKPGTLPVAVVHIFRFQGDRVVELWDVGQPVPETSPNQYGMF